MQAKWIKLELLFNSNLTKSIHLFFISTPVHDHKTLACSVEAIFLILDQPDVITLSAQTPFCSQSEHLDYDLTFLSSDLSR